MSVPLSYRNYQQLRPTVNEANLKASIQTVKNEKNSQIEGNNPLPTDAEELNLNGDSFETKARGKSRLQGKEVKLDVSAEGFKEVPVSYEKNMEDQSKELSHSKSGKNGKNHYNSYRKYNPDQYLENSAEWQMAMIRYLLDMKNNGHHVKEVKVEKVTKKFKFQP